MNKKILKASTLTLLAAAMTVIPFHASAAGTNKPAIKKVTPAKQKPLPFHGALTALDKTKMTITVGESTYQITSETKITQEGKPAIIGDGVVGNNVSGVYKTGDGGKLIATTVNFGTKAAVKPVVKPVKKPKAKNAAATTTNSPAMTN